MGEVIRGDFGRSNRELSLLESTQPSAEPGLLGLSEAELIQTATAREEHLIEANRQLLAGQISTDELFEAVAATVRVRHLLTEDQCISAIVSAHQTFQHNTDSSAKT